MIKIVWNFVVVGILCNCLLLTNIYAQDTSTSNMALASAATLKALDDANKVLEAKNALFNEAQAGINSPVIKQREAELAAVIARQKAEAPLSDPDLESARLIRDQAELGLANNNLAAAKVPRIDAAYLNKTRSEADQAQIAKNDLTNKAIQEGITAKTGTLTQLDISGKEGVLGVIKQATDSVELNDQYTEFTDAEKFKEYRRRDIVMLVISQVTSRLKSCQEPQALPPDMITSIAGGAAFVTGEVAEYQTAEQLKQEMTDHLKTTTSENLQLAYFYTLRKSYTDLLATAKNKQNIRNISTAAFTTAATQATAEDNEDQALANACRDQNAAMTNSGKNQGDGFNMMEIAIGTALIAAGYSTTPVGFGLIAAGMAAIALGLVGKGNGESCKSGGASTSTNIINRQQACDQLGEFTMFNTADAPTTTSSKVIRDRCLLNGETVGNGAGSGCSNHSSSGAGPYSACDMASDAYKRNMVACPVTVLKDGANPNVANLSTAGVSEVAGSALVKNASYEISRALDLRMASPAQRGFVWEAFSTLAKNASDNTAEMIQKIQAQLDKLNLIIAEMEALKDGVVVKQNSTIVTPLNTTSGNVNGNTAIDVNLKSQTDCMTSTLGGACKTVTDAMSSSVSFNNFPSDLQVASRVVGNGLNLMNGKSRISAGELNNAAKQIAKQTQAINNMLASKKKLQQAIMQANGNRSGFGKDSQKFNDMLSGFNSKNGSTTGSGTTGSGTTGSGSSSGTSSGTSSSDSAKNDALSGKNGIFGNNSFSSGQNLGGPSAIGNRNNSKNGDKENAAAAGAGAGADDNAKKLQNASDAENARILADAIEARNKNNKNKYQSSDENTLFEKVTNAYIRNYDKLLTKKTIKFETK